MQELPLRHSCLGTHLHMRGHLDRDTGRIVVDMVLIAINGSSILSMGQREVRSSSYNEGVLGTLSTQSL